MKKLLLFTLSLCTAGLVMAQNPSGSYTFNRSNDNRVPLSGATKITAAGWTDGMEASVPFGFDFPFNGKTYTTCTVDYDGLIALGNAEGAILPYRADLHDRGNDVQGIESVISYITDGNAPNRIFKLEYDICGFQNGSDDAFIAFQVWMHESGTIEFYFGTQNVAGAFTENKGAVVALGFATGATPGKFNYWALNGDPGNPTTVEENDVFGPASSLDTGVAHSGTLYTFTSTTTGINEDLNTLAARMFPNPANGVVTIAAELRGEEAQVRVLDLAGREVFTGNMATDDYKIDISALKQSAYFVEVSTKTRLFREKLMVQ